MLLLSVRSTDREKIAFGNVFKIKATASQVSVTTRLDSQFYYIRGISESYESSPCLFH